ncbi:MAG: hypothetical protein R3B13_21385 [Polyangiaceae bacterium]
MTSSDSFQAVLDRLQDACFDAEESGDWDASSALALQAVQAARTLAELWQIVDLEPGADATYGEGAWPPEFLEAIFRKTTQWSDAELAGAITLATRLTARDPGRLALIDDELLEPRPELVAVHDRHVDLFREGIASSDAALRTASLHALGTCHGSDAADLERVVSLIAEETLAEPLATALLCLGSLARRCGRGADATRLVDSHRGHDSLLVRCCAAAAAAVIRGNVDDEHLRSLACAMTDPVRLPSQWGWTFYGRWETSAHLALRVLSWAVVPTHLRLEGVHALASVEHTRELTDLIDDTLFRIAFGTLSDVPELGFSVGELDEPQRAAVAAFADGEGVDNKYLQPLGLSLRRDVEPFLSGSGGFWKPLEVRLGDGVRRWHLARAWREHVWGNLGADETVRAIVSGLDPRQLVEALCSNHASILLKKATSDTAKLTRDLKLLMRIMQELANNGFDLVDTMRQLAEDDSIFDRRPHALGLIYGCAHRGEALPADVHAVVGRGLAFDLEEPAIVELLNQLGDAQQQAITAAARAYLDHA